MSYEPIFLNAHTSDATPLPVVIRAMLPDSAMTYTYSAIAKSAGNLVRSWNGSRTVQRIGTAAPVNVAVTANPPAIEPPGFTGNPSITTGAIGADKAGVTLVGVGEIDWAITIHLTAIG